MIDSLVRGFNALTLTGGIQSAPLDLVGLFASYLPLEDRARLARCCKRFSAPYAFSVIFAGKINALGARYLSYCLKVQKPIDHSRLQKVTDLDLKNQKLSLERLQEITRCFPNLEKLSLSLCDIDDRGVAALCKFSSLKTLSLQGNSRVTGATFDTLPRTLESLTASQCTLDDQAIGALSSLSRLVSLTIFNNPGIEGTTLDLLPQSLKSLSLAHCSVGDQELLKLKLLKSLQKLDCTGNKKLVSPQIGQLSPTIQWLSLARCSLSQSAVGQIQSLTHISKFLHR